MKGLLFGICLICINIVNAQLYSPETYLGYKIGNSFTPHYKIAAYFKYVASVAKNNMQLQTYGTTNEGRPLMVAIISSEENMKHIDEIKQNNLAISQNNKSTLVSQPVIVWLSYNVHGNEPSSSEAAMLTLYALLDENNSKTKEWLKNTVVIIDPCLNPDGRERYVNWYNSIVAKKPDVLPNSREHNEPWPEGRTNHYYFDLNRDWAWQTQVETQQRLLIYRSWMPQVHVDYHEQGINAPYYFAPAAQPYHDVITNWQRNFQIIIGKNNAKYFDNHNWLYFTKEIFDLYYPSYGDTYPTYNGAIGMTYEQAGIGAGLAVINHDGDTLTLADRALHHFTTSLSTIEISSIHATELLTEFKKYFSDNVQFGRGVYKTFILKYQPETQQNLSSLLILLKQNGIEYGSGNGNANGFNYLTGKEEIFSLNKKDVLISTHQPNGALVQALFEPKPHLVDSLTYDISAWALPYMYGLNAFAVKDYLLPLPPALDSTPLNSIETSYGYVFKWQGLRSAQLTSDLLNNGITLRFADMPFEINNEIFNRGSIIILKTSNQKLNSLWQTVNSLAIKHNIQLTSVPTGWVDHGFDFGSEKVHTLKSSKIFIATGEGVYANACGDVWHFIETELQIPVSLINASELHNFNWAKADVIILPAGTYSFLKDKESLSQFNAWLNNGGKVIALETAVDQISKAENNFLVKKQDLPKKDSVYTLLKTYENRDRDAVNNNTPGAIFKVYLDETHPLAYGYPNYYYHLKMDDNIYEFMKDGWNVGVVKKDAPIAGFVGSSLQPKLKDGLLIGQKNIGNGSIIFFSDNLLFRNFWQNGKLMFCNALFFVNSNN